MQETLRTVKYSVQDAGKFESIALKLGRPKRLVFSQMIDYFYRSKKDPTDLSDDLLKNTILKGQKEYIGFIKTQENELLIPIKRDVARTIESQKNIVECFNAQVLRQNNEVLKNQQAQTLEISTLNEVVKSINGKMATKEKLKSRFMYILNTYIKTRESFGLMTSSKEKEELATSTREQVNIL
ncbi:hypothetical protein HDE68_002943 [Pedobacter cryoconitis]|uniref:Mobilization protein n=1 Tax=Pedobacter cryoconitis TaxID=188932 RepID=A0A7W9E0V9_9SPHI|nr:BfmA/BtgA family mobilization protein [Pedobacter cryoconitis]MBB5637030.1 hypothetical protein [Pedobacter cryoconitis]